MKTIPFVVENSVVRRGLELLSRQFEIPIDKEQSPPMIPPEPDAQELAKQDQRRKEFLRQILKQHVALSRSKLKTHRLAELCRHVMQGKRKSEAWFVKYEKFLRSPVWKLVSEEALRKAQFRCEYLGCRKRANQAYLLEIPEEHLELNFSWVKRDNILIALCCHHREKMHGFIMKAVVPSNREPVQFNADSANTTTFLVSAKPANWSAGYPAGEGASPRPDASGFVGVLSCASRSADRRISAS